MDQRLVAIHRPWVARTLKGMRHFITSGWPKTTKCVKTAPAEPCPDPPPRHFSAGYQLKPAHNQHITSQPPKTTEQSNVPLNPQFVFFPKPEGEWRRPCPRRQKSGKTAENDDWRSVAEEEEEEEDKVSRKRENENVLWIVIVKLCVWVTLSFSFFLFFKSRTEQNFNFLIYPYFFLPDLCSFFETRFFC